MVPIDHRNHTFRDLQTRLVGLRLSVWEALLEHGPCTTRDLAQACGIDLLTVRPRMTELHQLGLVTCLDHEGHEGRYQALTLAEAETLFLNRQAATHPQLALGL
ncbi:MAG: hypothetical protein OJI67_08645 [Prosthecobacter sp.]|nr:hypothetical protein [Prosthecobacter sp.]